MRNKSGKYLNKTKAKFPLSVYLSYLLALTLVFSGFTMAKYSSEATGTATAQVAKFDVKLVPVTWPASNPEVMNISETKTYSLQVQNDSDVSVNYTLHVKTSSKIVSSSDNIIIKLNDEVLNINAGEEIVRSGDLKPGEFDPYDFVVISSNKLTANKYTSTFTFTLDAEQVD